MYVRLHDRLHTQRCALRSSKCERLPLVGCLPASAVSASLAAAGAPKPVLAVRGVKQPGARRLSHKVVQALPALCQRAARAPATMRGKGLAALAALVCLAAPLAFSEAVSVGNQPAFGPAALNYSTNASRVYSYFPKGDASKAIGVDVSPYGTIKVHANSSGLLPVLCCCGLLSCVLALVVVRLRPCANRFLAGSAASDTGDISLLRSGSDAG